MDSKSPHQHTDDALTPGQLLKLCWAAKWLVIGITLLVTVASGAAALILPKSYKAIAILSPANNSSSGQLGGLGNLASQFGGIASLAGISVGSGDSQKAESLATLQSEALTEQYIRQNDLLPMLYKDKWDVLKSQWKDMRPGKVPTLWKANAYFKKKVRGVTTDPKSGLIVLSITYSDPHVAAKWANDLVKMTNEYLRDKAVNESERNIAYLNDEASKTNIVEVRLAIYKILENEINKMMLARGNNEYAFKVLDPAFAPERASSPDLLLWTIGGVFGGFLISGVIVFVRETRRSRI